MIAFPNAKINIGLEVINKRPDGYHNIQSIFYPVSGLYDVLEMVAGKSDSDRFFFSGLEIPGSMDSNLVFKAISLLRDKYDIPNLDVYLHKVIPMGAGLGGGSSDGAFALRLINEMFNLQMSSAELKEDALELGSDCPFFIDNIPIKVSGRGEVFEPTSLSLKGKYIAVASSPIHISTADAYKNVTLSKPSDLARIDELDVKSWQGQLVNSFEPFALSTFPKLNELHAFLMERGALYVSMTGSGSSFYAIFENEPSGLSLDGIKFWTGRL